MNIFNSIPLLKPKRNIFNLSNENKMTTDMFRLTPFLCKEALPDDVFKLRPEIFARALPMLAPVMHRFNIRAYYFFVPTRIIWDDFEKWINPKNGLPRDGSKEINPIVSPRINFTAEGAEYAYAPKSLGDYLGVNVGFSPEDYAKISSKTLPRRAFTGGFTISALPFRAYQQVYNDWFIDLNNSDVEPFDKGSGEFEFSGLNSDTERAFYNSLLKMRYRAWEHDYFTSAMPNAQRGADVMAFEGGAGEYEIEGVSGASLDPSTFDIPKEGLNVESIEYDGVTYTSLEAMADAYASFGFTSRAEMIEANDWVTVDGSLRWADYSFRGNILATRLNNSHEFRVNLYVGDGYGGGTPAYAKLNVSSGGSTHTGPTAHLFTIPASDVASILKVVPKDLNSFSGVTVEELRVRMQMQSFLERNEIGGSRYTEMLYAHWGVKDPDGRLQRSEFIGGHKQPIIINDISQTSAPTDDDPLGQWAGQALSSASGRSLKYHVPEHGFIIGMLCIMPRTGYFQGLQKMWKRFDRLDYYWPSFAHLGEQEVKNHEVFFSPYDPDGTFGYQQRYAEYKCAAQGDEVHGDLKGNLAFYHDARVFQSADSEEDIPKLSAEFTTPQFSGQDGVDRIFPVLSDQSEYFNADHFIVDVYNHVVASRRIPKNVTPRNGS